MSLFKNALLENWNRVHSALTEQKRSDQLLRRLGYLAVQSIRNGTAMVRQCREQICDSIKMHTHYGPVGDFIHNVKTLQVRLQKRSSIGTPRSMPSRGDHGLSSPLRNKLKKIKDSYRIDNILFDNPPTIIFISNFLPRFDKTSSDFRLFNILRILLANKCRIEYLYCAKTADDEKYAKALKGKIGLTYVPIGQQDYIKTIAEKNPDYVWITSLWRIDYVRFMAQLIKSLKQQHPSLKLIVDTMDFHYKEFLRKYEWTKNKDDLKLANEFLENEQNLYRTADTVVVISEEEKGDIQDKIMGISNCEVVPNIHDILDASRPYSGRRNICFVGHFGNRHNVDAVRYLVIGSLKNLDKALTYYKLFVCPMTYGAGMKGKIGGAIAAGVPIVTTSIGAEGFPVRDGKECFIADSPMEFGEKCNQCLNDPITWHNLSVKSRLMIAENFSPHVVAGKLVKVLST